MIQIQVVPREGVDAYRLLRSRLREARTWSWANKAKTRLKHRNSDGHIRVANGGGVVAAWVVPKEPKDLFVLVEKFVGRLVAWFEADLAAINVQFSAVPPAPRRRRRRAAKRRPGTRKRR